MKKLFVSLFMSAALICGMSAMAQSTAGAVKSSEKAKTEVKADACKKAQSESKCAKASQKTKAEKTAATPTKTLKK